MRLYTKSDLSAQTIHEKPLNCSATTNSISVTNMSHMDLQISVELKGSYILPAFSSKTFAVSPGKSIIFQPVAPALSVTPPANIDEYIDETESPLIVETGIQPLALVPVYTSTVNIANSPTVSISSEANTVNIGNTPSVTLSGETHVTIDNAEVPITATSPLEVTIQNASVPITSSAPLDVNINSGTVEATIQNAYLEAQVINNNSSPVPTVPQSYYGTGSDGTFNPSITTYFNENMQAGTDFWYNGVMSFSANGASAPSSANTASTAIQNKTALPTSTDLVIQSKLNIGYSSGGYEHTLALATSNNIALKTAGQNSIGLDIYMSGTNFQFQLQQYQGTTFTGYPSTAVSVPTSNIPQGTVLTFKIVRLQEGTITATVTDQNGTVWFTQTINDPFNASNYYASILLSQSTTTTPYWYVTNLSASDPYYTFNNTANVVEIKNFTSVNIPSGVIVRWKNPVKYVVWFVQGNVTVSGTIIGAIPVSNVGGNNQITVFNGTLTVPFGGMGGNGGKGCDYNTTYTGGTGGVGGKPSAYGGGAGGSGGNGGDGTVSGASGNPGTNGGGYGTGGAWYASSYPNTVGQNGQNTNGSTFILIANGSVTVTGTINLSGGQGGNGGQVAVSGSYDYSAGAGGGAGYGGNAPANANKINSFPPGGGGGAGGGVAFIYASGAVSITGTINVNGGQGGKGGTMSIGAQVGQDGQTGQAGTIAIFQNNNAVGG